MIIFNVLKSKIIIESSSKKSCLCAIVLWVITIGVGFSSCNSNGHSEPFIFYNNQNLDMSSDSIYYLAGSLFSGTIISSTVENKNEKSYSILNGKLHGSFLEWTPEQHILKTDKSYLAGKEHGRQRGYHYNGNLSFSYNAVNGKREGLYQEFYPSGNLHIEKIYKEGKQVSNKIKNPQGAVIANYVLKNGRYYGLMGSSSCISVLLEENSRNEN